MGGLHRIARANLVLLAFALLAWAALIVRVQFATPEPLEALAPGLGEIRQIRIDCTQCEPKHFMRDQDRWTLQPGGEAVDPTRLQALLDLPLQAVHRSYALDTLDAERVGLAPPAFVIRLDEVAFEFGTTEAVGNLRYVRSQGRIVLISDRVGFAVQLPPSAFLLDGDTAAVGSAR